VDNEHITDNEAGRSESVDTGVQWQRLSVIAILYFTFSNLKNLAQGLIYVVPALAVTANITDNIHSNGTYIGILVLMLSTSLSGVVSFFMYTFRVHNAHIEIHHGVFSRRFTNLPFWRIQNVKIEHPFYYRPFGYALVVLDTAGSASEEANIVAVPNNYAQALKKQVLAFNAQNTAPEPQENEAQAPVTQDSDETVLNRRSITDLVIHGITNNRVWILLGAAAPFYDDIFSRISGWLASKGLQLNQLVGEQTIAWWQFGLYALIIVMMLMAAIALISVGGALFTFYGYTLSKQDDRYIRRSGLLNKQEVSMRASRIQMITAKQDWLDKVLKRVNLYFEQNVSTQQHGQELMSPNKLIVPSVTETEALALAKEVMPNSCYQRHDYMTISKRFILHWSVVGLAVPFGLFFTVGIITAHLDIVAMSISVCLLLLGVIGLRWWRWGIATDDKYIYVRRGRVGIDYLCFEPYKIQELVIQQSIFMKRRKLASIKFVLASGSVTVPFLPEDYVFSLADKVMHDVESTQRSWM